MDQLDTSRLGVTRRSISTNINLKKIFCEIFVSIRSSIFSRLSPQDLRRKRICKLGLNEVKSAMAKGKRGKITSHSTRRHYQSTFMKRKTFRLFFST